MRKRITVVPLMASMMGVLSVAAPASAATTDTTQHYRHCHRNPGEPDSVSTTAAPVLNPTGVVGSNTVAWNPTLVLTVPGGTPSGTYTSTLTQSVV
jgi:hypothetical protein